MLARTIQRRRESAPIEFVTPIPRTDSAAQGNGIGSIRVAGTPTGASLRFGKGKEEREKKGKRRAPGLEGGRGLWPASVAICIKRSPFFSCCLARGCFIDPAARLRCAFSDTVFTY